MDYYKKYLKYKNKYSHLKELLGGDNLIVYDKEKIESEIIKEIGKYVNEFNDGILCMNDPMIIGSSIKLNSEKNICIINDNNIIKIKYNNNIIPFIWIDIIANLGNNLKDIVLFRYYVVDNIYQLIINNFEECKKDNKIICIAKESGTSKINATLQSDYDLTLYGTNKTSLIIQIFNSIIIKYFGNTSSHIFDTNFYGYSYLIPKNENFTNKNFKDFTYNDTIYKFLDSNFDISRDQDEWSILRLKTLLPNYLENILKIDTKLIFNNKPKLNQKEYYNMSSIDKSNEYIIKMKQFENLLDDENNIINVDKLIESLSYMNYYGDETYFTQGAFTHVVGTMFYFKNNEFKDHMKIYYYIHSMVENLSYFIYAYYIHFENKKIEEIEKIFYAIKYYHRFIDALYKLHDSNIILDLIETLSFIKNNLRNNTDEQIRARLSDNNKTVDDIKNEYFNSLNNNFYLLSLIELLKSVIKLYPNNTYIRINDENGASLINMMA